MNCEDGVVELVYNRIADRYVVVDALGGFLLVVRESKADAFEDNRQLAAGSLDAMRAAARLMRGDDDA